MIGQPRMMSNQMVRPDRKKANLKWLLLPPASRQQHLKHDTSPQGRPNERCCLFSSQAIVQLVSHSVKEHTCHIESRYLNERKRWWCEDGGASSRSQEPYHRLPLSIYCATWSVPVAKSLLDFVALATSADHLTLSRVDRLSLPLHIHLFWALLYSCSLPYFIHWIHTAKLLWETVHCRLFYGTATKWWARHWKRFVCRRMCASVLLANNRTALNVSPLTGRATDQVTGPHRWSTLPNSKSLNELIQGWTQKVSISSQIFFSIPTNSWLYRETNPVAPVKMFPTFVREVPDSQNKYGTF